MPGQCRKPVLNVSASSRSRKLGTAFRSPVTTLSHHYEVKAPALFLRFLARALHESVRSKLFRSFRFRRQNRANLTIPPRYPQVAPPLLRFPRSPLPFGYFNPLDLSVQPASSQEARFA